MVARRWVGIHKAISVITPSPSPVGASPPPIAAASLPICLSRAPHDGEQIELRAQGAVVAPQCLSLPPLPLVQLRLAPPRHAAHALRSGAYAGGQLSAGRALSVEPGGRRLAHLQ
jgi:hypothetical protein